MATIKLLGFFTDYIVHTLTNWSMTFVVILIGAHNHLSKFGAPILGATFQIDESINLISFIRNIRLVLNDT